MSVDGGGHCVQVTRASLGLYGAACRCGWAQKGALVGPLAAAARNHARNSVPRGWVSWVVD